MTFEEAMRERHTVRKFTDKEIPKDIRSKLNTRFLQITKNTVFLSDL